MKRILVVVDMQNDFIGGVLGTPEARGIVAGVVKKMEGYPREHILALRDTHDADYLETAEGRHLPVVHCLEGTKGWEIVAEIDSLVLPENVVNKRCFGSIALAQRLQEISLREEIAVDMVGLCTDICVVSNALLLKTYMPEVEVTVDAKCCAGITKGSHDAALETMKMCQIEILGAE